MSGARLLSASRRLQLAALVVLLLWQSPGMPWDKSCYAGPGLSQAPREPLVLIGEPGGGETEIPKDFIAACERQGYVAGESLFQASLDIFSDLGQGAEQAADFVNACSAKSPAGQVDVIACGVSGLVTRLALDRKSVV